ncbi:MAG: 2,3-bisphosphoglycerate-independent phosphoglycerate mutase [Bacilli bacterium]
MKPIVLTIMDGVGLAKSSSGNAYDLAKKPNLELLQSIYPTTRLNASENYVGLPKHQMGNSEVGHLNIGAGRVVYQQLERINKSFNDNSIVKNQTYLELVKFAKKNNNVVHLMGLLSDGGVHAHINHLMEMLKRLTLENITVYSHIFLDGRDVGPTTSLEYVTQYEKLVKSLNNGYIVSVSGRFFAMDRDLNLERTNLAYDAIISALASSYESVTEGINASYKQSVYDENIVPFNIKGYQGANDGDGFIFMNFRPDRAIQISNAILENEFKNIYFATISRYTRVNSAVLFEAEVIKNGLGEVLANNNYKQLRIAETEKYAHVTFFFDGGIEQEYKGMKKVLINSPKVATYDMKPEMSANEVTNSLLNELDNDYDVVILNFANPDMVGHTGNVKATIKAIETVDHNIGRIYNKVMSLKGVMIICADHGNSEYLLDEKGDRVTAHTLNQVPFILTKQDVKLKDSMSLCNIAPTILELLNEKQPQEMTGESIIMEDKNE